MLAYSVPYELLARTLTRPILRLERSDVASIYRAFVARMNPRPVYEGLDNLPAHTRFILAANHYQRKGLWIAHAASALACAMEDRYTGNPPIRYVVTANWPKWRIGPVTIPSPGDILLPRVAHAVWCYAVPFAGANPAATAGTLRRLIADARSLDCPIGLFPEGTEAVAGHIEPPLPGVGRFLSLMASRGWSVVPAAIFEAGGFVIRFGRELTPDTVRRHADPALHVMTRIASLLEP